MTAGEKNEALARACGWSGCPDSCSSLNVVQLARTAVISSDVKKRVRYLNSLRDLLEKKHQRQISDFDMIDADAEDHVDAILKAIV